MSLPSSSFHNSPNVEPKCSSPHEWIKNSAVTVLTEYHSTMKSNEVLIHFATWMDLENIILCERNQSQRSHIV